MWKLNEGKRKSNLETEQNIMCLLMSANDHHYDGEYENKASWEMVNESETVRDYGRF